MFDIDTLNLIYNYLLEKDSESAEFVKNIICQYYVSHE